VQRLHIPSSKSYSSALTVRVDCNLSESCLTAIHRSSNVYFTFMQARMWEISLLTSRPVECWHLQVLFLGLPTLWAYHCTGSCHVLSGLLPITLQMLLSQAGLMCRWWVGTASGMSVQSVHACSRNSSCAISSCMILGVSFCYAMHCK
jgi:hypothetical protein